MRSGKASAEKMTAEQRKERAMKGVEARKERSKLPSAEYEGKIKCRGNPASCSCFR